MGGLDDFEYHQATNLEDAWVNFEPDLPLRQPRFGGGNPFYVDRPGDPIERLIGGLSRRFLQPPKYFLSGHRGCGKSTELGRVAADRRIVGKYWPVHFSILNEADILNLDYKDVLLAIAGQLYRQYNERKSIPFPEQLEKEIERWRGQITEEITRTSPQISLEVQGGLSVFFAKLNAKMKVEPETRKEVRRVIENNVTGLLDLISLLTTTIHTSESRLPLRLRQRITFPLEWVRGARV
jgi:hypothetical protein